MRRVIPRVIERTACLSRIEHRADERQGDVARHAGDQNVELLRRGARFGEKRAQLHLPDVSPNAARREIGLNELLQRVVTTADGEEIELEWPAVSLTPAVGASPPT